MNNLSSLNKFMTKACITTSTLEARVKELEAGLFKTLLVVNDLRDQLKLEREKGNG